MGRLIDAKDFDLRVANKSMTEVFPNWKELPQEVQDAVCKHAQHLHMLLETQPTIEAEPVVHAYWERYNENGDWRCSNCKGYHFHNGGMIKKYKRCPNCGAHMDLKEADNDPG